MEANHTALRATTEASDYSLRDDSPCLGSGTGGTSIGAYGTAGSSGGTYFGPWAQWRHMYISNCKSCLGGKYPGKAWEWITATRVTSSRAGNVPMCDHAAGSCSGGESQHEAVYLYGPCVPASDLGQRPPPMGSYSASCSGSGPCSGSTAKVECQPVYWGCCDRGGISVVETTDCADAWDPDHPQQVSGPPCVGPYCTHSEAYYAARRDGALDCEASDSSISLLSESSESTGGLVRYYAYCADVYKSNPYPCGTHSAGENGYSIMYSNIFALRKEQVCVADGGTNESVPNPNSPAYEYGCNGGQYSIGCQWALRIDSHLRAGPFQTWEEALAYVLPRGNYMSGVECSSRS